MTHVITVAPTTEGWVMQSGENAPLLFETSAQTVWSARKVGEAVASGGVAAEIVVLNRDGRQAGRCQDLPPGNFLPVTLHARLLCSAPIPQTPDMVARCLAHLVHDG